ncbi:MAG: HAD family phosphatase [Saprospiraceae bacterium]|nr:HAD family phosphatase [Saprospiraceae bacterium]
MTRFQHIKNIIFDFGGVIYDIDFKLSNIKFKKFGINNLEELYFQAQESKLFEKLEKSEISASDFCEEIRKISGKKISDDKIFSAWNALLIGYKIERIELLESIKKNYRTFLLSNTNIIHYEHYLAQLQNQFGHKDFSELFEKAYFSHQIKMKKPDKEIYEFVLSENNLKAEETLFIDDSKVNIEAAGKLGIQTYLLNVEMGEKVVSLFENAKLNVI